MGQAPGVRAGKQAGDLLKSQPLRISFCASQPIDTVANASDKSIRDRKVYFRLTIFTHSWLASSLGPLVTISH